MPLSRSLAAAPFKETIYAKLRRSIALSRFNNPRTRSVMATPPTISTSATLPSGLTISYLAGASTQNVWRTLGGARLLGGPYWNVQSTTLPSQRAALQYRHEIMVDSVKFAIRLYGSTLGLRFLFDGQYASLTPTTSATSSGDQYIVFDFTSAGGRAIRRFAVEWAASATGFAGIYVGATETCQQSPAPPFRLGLIGDSYLADAGVSFAGDGFPAALGDYLGTSDAWAMGIGGTGFLSPGTAWPYLSHIGDLVSCAPDVAFIGSAANDYPSYSNAQITAAVMTYVQTARSYPVLATTPLFVFGSWTNQLGVTSANTAADAAVGAAVTALRAAGDAAVFFISVAADPNGSWITGTGSTLGTNGTGNSDVYGAGDGHLIASGWKFFAGRTVDQVSQIIAALP